MKKRVSVLGASGSIGKSTLDILRNERERFEPVLFSANKNKNELIALKKEFPHAITALSADEESDHGGLAAPGIDFFGKQGLLKAIKTAGADISVNGISGAAGLEPSAAVLQAGSDLALANKETVVMAGQLIFALARENNVRIIPVDSEHSAVFKLIEAHGKEKVSEIILTASGGPFRNYSYEQLKNVTPEEALSHPTWNMGPKITVDSATMANKGLEVIEAAALFGFPPEKIKVTIHPQSIVHSLVRLANGAVYAQMSYPDMKMPIHDALCWPETEKSSYGRLDFDSLHLTFEKYDPEKFPMLPLAYEALKGSPYLPIVYNAVNEIAVNAFFKAKIEFPEIPCIVKHVLNESIFLDWDIKTIEAVLEIDKKARQLAEDYLTAVHISLAGAS